MDAGHGIPVLYPKIFTFKIFQNITFFLQGNDSKAQSDNSGTSRFSQWFEKKDPTNNNKPSTQDSQGNRRLIYCNICNKIWSNWLFHLCYRMSS